MRPALEKSPKPFLFAGCAAPHPGFLTPITVKTAQRFCAFSLSCFHHAHVENNQPNERQNEEIILNPIHWRNSRHDRSYTRLLHGH